MFRKQNPISCVCVISSDIRTRSSCGCCCMWRCVCVWGTLSRIQSGSLIVSGSSLLSGQRLWLKCRDDIRETAGAVCPRPGQWRLTTVTSPPKTKDLTACFLSLLGRVRQSSLPFPCHVTPVLIICHVPFLSGSEKTWMCYWWWGSSPRASAFSLIYSCSFQHSSWDIQFSNKKGVLFFFLLASCCLASRSLWQIQCPSLTMKAETVCLMHN